MAKDKQTTREDMWYQCPLGFMPNYHKHEHIMCRDLPHADPERVFERDDVINNQGMFQCPDCESETKNGGAWFFYCSGCGIGVVESGLKKYYTWPSDWPLEKRKSNKKPFMVKLVEEFQTYVYWTEALKKETYQRDSMIKIQQKSLEAFEMGLRRLIRDEMARVPISKFGGSSRKLQLDKDKEN